MKTVRRRTVRVPVLTRWMIRRDMAEILAIEENSFEHPWTEKGFMDRIRQLYCIGMVAEQDEKVVGFMVYEMHTFHMHLLRFAVHPDHRRVGIGQQMVDRLISKLSREHRTKITLNIRETNLNAQLFFRKQRFQAVRVVRGYFRDSGEDSFLMRYSLLQDQREKNWNTESDPGDS